jgi:hypothetical protein
MFRKIAATTVLALASLGVAAPAVGATTTATATNAKSYVLTGPNGAKVGQAVASFDHHKVTVWAATFGLAPGTYSVKVWVFHLGFRRHETVTVRTFEVPAGEMTTQQLAGCIGSVDMAAPHHNDLPVLAVAHGEPMHIDALARL